MNRWLVWLFTHPRLDALPELKRTIRTDRQIQSEASVLLEAPRGLPFAVQCGAVQTEQDGTGQDKGPLGLGWPRRGRGLGRGGSVCRVQQHSRVANWAGLSWAELS